MIVTVILEFMMYIISIILMWILMTKRKINSFYLYITVFMTILGLIFIVIYKKNYWYMYLLYAAVIIIVISIVLTKFFNVSLKGIIRKIINTIIIVLVALSCISNIAFPIYELPTPSGDYQIGTFTLTIHDIDRLEYYTEEEGDYRKFIVQIWYPAETVEGYEQVPWLKEGIVVSRALAKDFGFPFFLLDQTADILSHSYLLAPISTDKESYPVIILSHGWRGFRDLHVDYAEELASLGYIVVAIDHTYGSVVTAFDDENIEYINKDALPSREETPDFLDYANQLVNTYARDVSKTLDVLEGMNQTSYLFSGKFDLEHIGLLGHSTGGGGDVAVALNDERIDAIIGLDAWVEPLDGTDLEQGLNIPSLFLRSETWEEGLNNDNLYTLIQNSNSSTLYQIDDTTHYDFAMVYMYSPLTNYIGLSGKINDEYLVSILKAIIVGFFDETLKNEDNPINPDDYEKVNQIELT